MIAALCPARVKRQRSNSSQMPNGMGPRDVSTSSSGWCQPVIWIFFFIRDLYREGERTAALPLKGKGAVRSVTALPVREHVRRNSNLLRVSALERNFPLDRANMFANSLQNPVFDGAGLLSGNPPAAGGGKCVVRRRRGNPHLLGAAHDLVGRKSGLPLMVISEDLREAPVALLGALLVKGLDLGPGPARASTPCRLRGRGR